MTPITRIAAFLVLAAWLPATALCVVNCSTSPEDDICCPQSGDQNPSTPTKANCVFSSAFMKIDTQRVALSTPLIIHLPTALLNTSADAMGAELPPPIVPERIVVRWQFMTRAAPSPRAPSFVS